jgi:hypothetical protein
MGLLWSTANRGKISCKSGAISGALGEAGLNIKTDNMILGTIKGAMLGGIGSKLSGGKFADGATTGAFGYLFNELLHSGAGAMKRAGYEKTVYEDGTVCNFQSGPRGCGMPGARPSVSEGTQAGASAGVTGMFGIGGSFDIGKTYSTDGSCAVMMSTCALIGPMIASTLDVTPLNISAGAPSPGWNASIVGKLSLPVGLGLQGSVGYGSDGLNAQAGRSFGPAAGAALKVCTQQVGGKC